MERDERTLIARIPFTIYDVFGYLVPGTLFVFCVYFFEYRAVAVLGKDFRTPVLNAVEHMFDLAPSAAMERFAGQTSSPDPSSTVAGLVLLTILAYIIGHVISAVSSLFIDRALIFKGYGYPYEFLLSGEEGKDGSAEKSLPEKDGKDGDAKKSLPEQKRRRGRSPYSQPYYRGMFFWLNLLLLVQYWSVFSHARALYWVRYIVLALIAATLVLKVSLEYLSRKQRSVYKLIRQRPYDRLKKVVEFVIIRSYLRGLWAGVYNLVTGVMSRYINSRRGFSDNFIKRYKECFRETFDLDPDSEGTNNYWLTYCALVTRSRQLSSVHIHWLYLYSFARNLSTAFYIAFLYLLASLSLQTKYLGGVDYGLSIAFLPLGIFIVSFVMLFRYYYLYVCYYTKFLFRAFVASQSPRLASDEKR